MTLLFNNYEKLLEKKETWMILLILHLIVYLGLGIKISGRGRSESKGILVVLATKKKGFSSKLNSPSLSPSLERVALDLPLPHSL